MTKPWQRSRSKKRVKKKTPEGRVTTHFRRKRSGAPRCARCGRKLPGMRARNSKALKRLNRSRKKVNRPYGGNLCSACMRSEIRGRVRRE